MKNTLKILGLVLLLAAAFAAGLTWSSVQRLGSELGGPHVQSDLLARQEIQRRLPELPEGAHHLYYAAEGFQDVDEFFACSVPKADFAELLEQVRELARARDDGQPPLTLDPLTSGPNSWPESQKDPTWDPADYPDLVIEKTAGTTIMYSPSGHRVFVCVWSN